MRTEDFDAIYTQYFPRLWEFASRFVGSAAAEEVVQDVMLDIWKKAEPPPAGRELTAFLYSAVRRRSWDVMRHESIVERTESEAAATDDAIAMGEPSSSPDEYLLKEELYTAFEKTLETLPSHTRALLQLRWGEGLSYDEIARVLGISANAAKVQVSRARRVVGPLLKRFNPSL